MGNREMGDYLLSLYISGLNIVVYDMLGYKWPLDSVHYSPVGQFLGS